MIRIALVGLGVIARFYLAAIARRPDVRLVAVCDVDETTLAAHRERLACYSDHRSLLDHGGLDAVVLTVPNDAHGPVCRDALAAGIAVCVEKPLCLSVADGVELDRLAREHGVPLFTAFHRRYNVNFLSLVDDLVGAAPIESVRVRYLERIEEHIGTDAWYLDPVRCGGGCVADNGPNAFDLAGRLLGDLTVRDARIARDATGVDRQAIIELSAGSGVRARVELDWSYPGEVKDIEVRLADGSTRRADLLAGHTDFKGSLWHEYAGIVADFANVLRDGAGTGNDGLAALELVAATYRAAAKHPAAFTKESIHQSIHQG